MYTDRVSIVENLVTDMIKVISIELHSESRIPYSGKFSQEKIFVNFTNHRLFA